MAFAFSGCTFLVTGAAGFIGSHLCERLLADGHQVYGIDNFDPFYDRRYKELNLSMFQYHPLFRFKEMDLRDVSAYDDWPREVTAVIHLAGKAGVRPSIQAPLDYLHANITATNNILEWMKIHGRKKFLFASSSSIYGNNRKIPFSEEDNVDFPISPYASSKKACELLIHTYHHLHGLDTINLRFFTVYGPRQRPDLAIHKFIQLIDQDQPIPVYGDGSTARDYTFVTDTVQGIMRALHYLLSHEGVYETANLGNNNPVSLKELITTIYELMGKIPQLQYLPMQPGDVNITYADISKAQRLFQYEPNTPLRQGLANFIEWYQSARIQLKSIIIS